ncbi:MAG: response regulator [Rubritepida sp.]|jgi:CheY-like chemotaxis protein|nr:response regulator [Rubritepida sp.]MCU0944619.1 response regulator [Rubritepida sp.]
MARILLADDMPAVRRAVGTVLRRAGHEVVEVPHGQAARAALGVEHFDVLLTDVLMPELDGVSLLEEVIAAPRRPATIVMSGGSGGITGTDALRVAERTADAALAKPFESQELLDTVARVLRTRGSA